MLYVFFTDENINNFVYSSLNNGVIEVPNQVMKSNEDLKILNHIKNYVSSTLGKERLTLGVDKVDRVYFHLTSGLYQLKDTNTHKVLYDGVDMSGDEQEPVEIESDTSNSSKEEESEFISLLKERVELLKRLEDIDTKIKTQTTQVDNSINSMYELIQSLENNWSCRVEELLNKTTVVDDDVVVFKSVINNIKIVQDNLLSLFKT